MAVSKFGTFSNLMRTTSIERGEQPETFQERTEMTGVKNGFGDPREILPRRATSPPGRRRGLYAAAGGLAVVVIAAVALASNLGGKGGPGPAPAQGGP